VLDVFTFYDHILNAIFIVTRLASQHGHVQCALNSLPLPIC